MADTLTRLESFPFDSKFDGYDDKGYPTYDRAVGAHMLRTTFRQFFSDGIFGTPGDAFLVKKGTGWNITVNPGIGVIRGAMGGIQNDLLTIPLDSGTLQGAFGYAVLLRYDENDEYRSIYICVRKGEAGGGIPEPVDDAGVKELLLATVSLPSNASDVSGAILNDKRGSRQCPYAAPFERIDVSAVLQNVKDRGEEQYQAFKAYLNENYEYIKNAIDGTLAGQLQNKIDGLSRSMTDNDFVAYVTASTQGAEEKDVKASAGNIWALMQQMIELTTKNRVIQYTKGLDKYLTKTNINAKTYKAARVREFSPGIDYDSNRQFYNHTAKTGQYPSFGNFVFKDSWVASLNVDFTNANLYIHDMNGAQRSSYQYSVKPDASYIMLLDSANASYDFLVARLSGAYYSSVLNGTAVHVDGVKVSGYNLNVTKDVATKKLSNYNADGTNSCNLIDDMAVFTISGVNQGYQCAIVTRDLQIKTFTGSNNFGDSVYRNEMESAFIYFGNFKDNQNDQSLANWMKTPGVYSPFYRYNLGTDKLEFSQSGYGAKSGSIHFTGAYRYKNYSSGWVKSAYAANNLADVATSSTSLKLTRTFLNSTETSDFEGGLCSQSEDNGVDIISCSNGSIIFRDKETGNAIIQHVQKSSVPDLTQVLPAMNIPDNMLDKVLLTFNPKTALITLYLVS